MVYTDVEKKILRQFPKSIISSEFMDGIRCSNVAKQTIGKMLEDLMYDSNTKRVRFYNVKKSSSSKKRNKNVVDENIIEKLFLLIYKNKDLKEEFFKFILEFQLKDKYKLDDNIEKLYNNLYSRLIEPRYDKNCNWNSFKFEFDQMPISAHSLEVQAFISFITKQMHDWSKTGWRRGRFVKEQVRITDTNKGKLPYNPDEFVVGKVFEASVYNRAKELFPDNFISNNENKGDNTMAKPNELEDKPVFEFCEGDDCDVDEDEN